MRENPQIVNSAGNSTPQSREDADLQMIRAVLADDRLSYEQVVVIVRKITAPYVGETDEVAQ